MKGPSTIGDKLTSTSEEPLVKRLVILANSRKLQARCVAGREWREEGPGDWIRPVSDREHQEVSQRERMYENGSDPQILDIIDVPLLGRRADSPQTENWLLNPRWYWNKVGQLDEKRLSVLADQSPQPLWINDYSTYHGLNDRIPEERISEISGSLRLISTEDVRLRVFRPGQMFGDAKRRIQARFSYGDDDYHLRVTDPLIETAYFAREDGEYPLGRAYLTISLGELWQGYYYKLVAAIIGAET
jgi:hypothetical protein